MTSIVNFHAVELFGEVIQLVFLICRALGFSSLVAFEVLDVFAIADDLFILGVG